MRHKCLFIKKNVLLAITGVIAITICIIIYINYSASRPTIKWQHAFVYGSKLVLGPGNTLYTAEANSVSKYDGTTGHVYWAYPLPANGVETLLALPDTLYVGNNGTVYALDASTGNLKWKVGYRGDDCVLAYHSNTLYVGAKNIAAYSVQSGKTKWVFPFPVPVADPSAEAASTNVSGLLWYAGNVYFRTAYAKSKMYCLNAITGKVAWTQYMDKGVEDDQAPLPMGTGTSLFPISGNLLAIEEAGYSLHTYNMQTGKPCWSIQFTGSFTARPGEGMDRKFYVSEFAASSVASYDNASGRLVWRHKLSQGVKTRPVVDANGDLLVGSGRDQLYYLNSMTGETRKCYRLDSFYDALDLSYHVTNGFFEVFQIGQDGTIYISTTARKLYALSP